LPKHHLNQKLALGGPEIHEEGSLGHMVYYAIPPEGMSIGST
jgi:hypothetical protein